jgi:hypothetical protein
MRINDPDGRASASRPDSSGADKVDLLSLLRLAAAAESADEPSNVAKLSALSLTVLSGRYQVDAGVVSNSILQASLRLDGGSI